LQMSLMPPRFAIRAPVHGSRVALQAPSKPREASWDCVRNLVLKAETLGYDSVLIAQHMINPNNDELEQLEAWSVAAALAALTRRIEIIAETHPRLIHPATLAKMALQIEDISHGRLAIKLACACDEGERHEAGFGPIQTDENDTYGREWMSILKPLLHGARVSYSGAHFDVQDYKLVPSDRYRPRPKIYFDGASNRRAGLRLRRRIYVSSMVCLFQT
jgi:alkanesulfonate monooxygenase